MSCLKFQNKMNWSLEFNLSTILEAVAVVTVVITRINPEHALLHF